MTEKHTLTYKGKEEISDDIKIGYKVTIEGVADITDFLSNHKDNYEDNKLGWPREITEEHIIKFIQEYLEDYGGSISTVLYDVFEHDSDNAKSKEVLEIKL